MAANVAKLITDIKSLTLMEAAEVAKTLKEELGLPDAAPMMAMAAGGGGGAPAAAAEEQTEFTVTLTEVPADKKIAILKVVREITGLGLGEAKAVVEGTPKELKAGVDKATAEDIKKKIAEAGGVVKIS
jgi:large subunit ribosomal protein L7/L12